MRTLHRVVEAVAASVLVVLAVFLAVLVLPVALVLGVLYVARAYLPWR